MNVNSKQVCQTCLSHDRILYSVHTINYLLQTIDVFLILKEGGVCWECRATINNIIKFKRQIYKAQEVLSIQPQTISSLSGLKMHFNVVNIIYNYDDPLLNPTKESIKNEEGENTQDNITHDANLEICRGLGEVCNQLKECIVVKPKNRSEICKEKHIKKKSHCKCISIVKKEERRKENMDKTSEVKLEESKKNLEEISDGVVDGIMDKYTYVTYTKEDVIRIREDKRKHPNFKKIPFKCDTCVLGFIREDTYNLHKKNKHDKTKGEYVCGICQICFPSLGIMRRHEENHYSIYRCRLCKYDSTLLHSIISHCKLKHMSDTYGDIHCKQCLYSAKTPDDMAEHNREQHSLCCTECGEKFVGRNTLRKHKMRLHNKKREFVCDICKKTFVTKSRLEAHVVGHNSALAQRLSYCSACKVQYKNLYVYRSHLANSPNHSARTYKCTYCNKSFASKAYLKKHSEFYHMKKSQFVCAVCNKLFISRFQLTHHKQVHHGLTRSRSHACDTCGKKFYSVGTLRGHRLTHSEQRSYMCEDCGDTFKQPAALYTHTRLLHRAAKT